MVVRLRGGEAARLCESQAAKVKLCSEINTHSLIAPFFTHHEFLVLVAHSTILL